MLSYHWTFWNWQSKPRSTCPTTMSRDYLSLKRNSDGAPLLENSPQTEGMRRNLHKRRKWREPSVFCGRKEYSNWGVTAELSSKGIPPEFRFWLTLQDEEMRRILHFRWIKGVLLLRRRRGERSRFSCWAGKANEYSSHKFAIFTNIAPLNKTLYFKNYKK